MSVLTDDGSNYDYPNPQRKTLWKSLRTWINDNIRLVFIRFTFVDVSNAMLSKTYTSNAITVTGVAGSQAITITGGTYSINGGAYTAADGTVVQGDVVTLQAVSSASYSTAVDVALTIGALSDTYTVTTSADPVAIPIAGEVLYNPASRWSCSRIGL